MTFDLTGSKTGDLYVINILVGSSASLSSAILGMDVIVPLIFRRLAGYAMLTIASPTKLTWMMVAEWQAAQINKQQELLISFVVLRSNKYKLKTLKSKFSHGMAGVGEIDRFCVCVCVCVSVCACYQ